MTNIFQFTDSKLTGVGVGVIDQKQRKKPKNSQKATNLLDLLLDIQNENFNDQKNEQILTFDQFKDIINAYDFQKNQHFLKQNNTLMKPKWEKKLSLPSHHVIDGNKNGGLNMKKSGSVQYEIADHQTNSMQSNNKQVNYLNLIQQQRIHSKSSTKKLFQESQDEQQNKNINLNKSKLQNHNLHLGFQLTTNVHSASVKNQNSQSRQSISFHRSSAQSSRSFNGLQQINQYQIQKKLGKGAFASVMLCINVNTQQKYAMKIVSNKQLRRKLFSKNSQILANYYINNQIAILKKMQHQHIVKLYEVIQDQPKNKIYLILEYCSGGYINQLRLTDSKRNQFQYKKLLESECKRYYKQLCLAVDYIHNVAKISHRDIKPQNILLNDKDQVKLSDFGLGTEDIEVASKSGTKNYLPPQARNSMATGMALTANTITVHSETLGKNMPRVTTQMNDIWALGITLLVMLNGKYQQIEDQKLEGYINSMKDISSECKDFLSKCLKINPFERITASQMLDHPWIKAKKPLNYIQIHITKEEQDVAIVARNNIRN